ncbi:MAG: glycosyltransferase family 39 protein [Gaiellaceae bacterium]
MLGGAAALRLAPFLVAARFPSRLWEPDDRDYLPVAMHLRAAYGGASGALFDVGLRRPPGYPLFVRATFDIFGSHYAAVVGVQLVLSVATVALTYALASLVLPGPAPLLAAVSVAIDPASIVFANQMFTETLFTSLLVLAVLALVAASHRRSLGLGALSGVLLGAALLVRPVVEYLPLLLVVVIVAAAPGARLRAAMLAAVFLLGFAVPSGAWLVRNYARTGVPTISTIDGHNMLQYRAVGALVEDGEPRQLAQHDVLVRLASHVHPGENAAEVSRAEFSVGATILSEHPVGAFKSWLRGEARILFGPARSETVFLMTGRTAIDAAWLRILVAVEALVTVAIVGVGLVGAVLLGARRSAAPQLWISAAVAGYLVVVSGGPEAYSRFRVPVMPFLAVLGAHALTRVDLQRLRLSGDRRTGTRPSESGTRA